MPVFETAPVILEIGTAYTKVGFAGDPHPRFIIPSEVRDVSTGKILPLFNNDTNSTTTPTTPIKDQSYNRMLDFIQNVFFKYVMVSPRERKIVIVESVLCPDEIRENLAKILFSQLETLSIFYVPLHLVALSTLAIDTAIVIDIGYKEATVLPVANGVQILKAWQAQAIAADAVHTEIRRQLIDIGVKSEILTDKIIEDIKVRVCFVTTFSRAEQYRSIETLPAETINDFKSCPGVEYPINGMSVITIPGKLRETAFEVLFPHDNERNGLPYLVLDSILKCPIDLRKQLSENILLIGGTTMTLGLTARLKDELKNLSQTNFYKDKLFLNNFKFHTAPAKSNFTGWVGGSLYGGTDLVQTRSLTRDAYAKVQRVPDWVNLEDNRLYGSK